MIQLFPRKAHDTAYSLIVELGDISGPVNLPNGSTVLFTMVNIRTGAVKIQQAACTILNQTTSPGQVQYDWQSVDVDTPATYKCEWRVLFAGGKEARWPSGDYAQLNIYARLDNAP